MNKHESRVSDKRDKDRNDEEKELSRVTSEQKPTEEDRDSRMVRKHVRHRQCKKDKEEYKKMVGQTKRKVHP